MYIHVYGIRYTVYGEPRPDFVFCSCTVSSCSYLDEFLYRLPCKHPQAAAWSPLSGTLDG